jgi:hypothetical protein
MYKKIIVAAAVVFLTAISLKAQVNTSSPYSFYGIGDLEKQVLGQNLGMGGVGIGMRTPMAICPLNPASYSAFPMQSFIFQAGMRSRRVDYSGSDSKFTNYDNSFSSAAVGFRANKYWAASIGLLPLSSVGYQMQSNKNLSFGEETSPVKTNYLGTGGLTRIYFGNAFNYKKFSAGINVSYIFGTLDDKNTTSISDTNFTSISSDEKSYKVKSILLDYGLQYRDSLGNQWTYIIGANFSNRQNLKTTLSRYTRNIYVYGVSQFTDTLANDTLNKGNIQIPMSYGVGFSLISEKWLFAFDYSTQKWKGLQFLDQSLDYFADTKTFAFGAEYTPKYNSKNFFQTVNYRIGGHYTDYYLKFGNTQIKDYSLSVGFGIPIKKSSTKIDISFEAGQRGQTTDGLIKEQYYLMNLNFNIGDLWFIKRKFE